MHGQPSTSRNQLGFTHLSFEVKDLPAVEAHLVSLGAHVIEGSHHETVTPRYRVNMVFLADPDGARIELVEHHYDDDTQQPD